MANLYGFKNSSDEALFTKLNPDLQKALGSLAVPSTITSTIRSPAQNKAVGGVPKSYHMTGNAADIRTRDKTPEELAAITKHFTSQGFRVINEGDHLHVQPGSGGSQYAAAPSAPAASPNSQSPWYQTPTAGILAQNNARQAPPAAYGATDYNMGDMPQPPTMNQPPIGGGPRKRKSFLASLGDSLGGINPLFGALNVLFQKKDKSADATAAAPVTTV